MPLKPTDASSPEDYIAQIDEPRRAEIEALDQIIREEVPELEAHLRSGMLGYGSFRYRYASGREGEAAVIALASQKRHISLYVGVTDRSGYFAERLPRASIGKSCVRFQRLSQLDEPTVRELLRESARRFADDPNFAIVG